MTIRVGDYILDLDWTAGVVGWWHCLNRHYSRSLPAWHVTLSEVVAANPSKRDEILRHHREALTLLALCQAKLQLELDNVEGML